MKHAAASLLAGFLALLSAGPAQSQAAEDMEAGLEVAGTPLASLQADEVLEGPDVPSYYVVRSFLWAARTWYEEGEQEFDWFIRDYGLHAHDPLAQMIAEVKPEIDMQLDQRRPHEVLREVGSSRAAFRDQNTENTLLEATLVGERWGRILHEFQLSSSKGKSIPPESFSALVMSRTRPNVSIVVVSDPDRNDQRLRADAEENFSRGVSAYYRPASSGGAQ